MLDWPEIAERTQMRRDARQPLVDRMVKVSTMYDGLWVLQIPGANQGLSEPIGPAIVAEAIDNQALKAATVSPDIICPPLEALKTKGVRSEEYAGYRRRALQDAWARVEGPLLLGKTFRHLIGYATVAFQVEMDWATGQPVIAVRDPMNVYPEFRADTDFRAQQSVATIYRRSGREIVARYPHARQWINSSWKLEATYQVCQWDDTDQTAIGVIACESTQGGTQIDSSFAREWGKNAGRDTIMFPLDRWESPTGLCNMVTLGAISLSVAISRLSSFSTQMEHMARLMALELRAAEQDVFPDKYVIGREGEVPTISGGWKPGSTGEVNMLSNVDQIGILRNTPGRSAVEMIDRLERNMRVSGGQSSLASGEQGSNALRTGRAIDSMMNVSSDPRIAEYQRLMATAMQQVNRVVLANYKAYGGSKKYTIFSPGRSAWTSFDFVPSVHIETLENKVRYALVGSDADATTIRLGQLVGTEMLSRDTAREMHPLIDDPEEEKRRIVVAKFEELVLGQIQAAAADPNGPMTPVDLARMAQLIQEGKSVSDAVIQAQKEAQERQASIAPPPMDPALGTAPEAMPGMAAPGMGAEMQPPAAPIEQTTDPLARIKSLVQAGRVPYGGATGPLG